MNCHITERCCCLGDCEMLLCVKVVVFLFVFLGGGFLALMFIFLVYMYISFIMQAYTKHAHKYNMNVKKYYPV